MEYNFFDENKEENAGERIPAPQQEIKTPPINRKKKAAWGRIILSLLLAAVSFGVGAFTVWASLDPEMRTLLKVKENIQEHYYKEVSDEEFYKAIFGGINENLLDPYSQYMTPEEFAASISDLEGNRIGVGLVFAVEGVEPLRITRVCGNSPAEEAGIVAGEVIIGVGTEEDGVRPCASFEEFSSFLAGFDEGERFVLQLQKGASVREVTTYKAAYVENYVFYRTNKASYTFTGDSATELTEKGTPLTCLDDDTAYIRLIQFTANASAEFDGAMAQFKEEGKKHLILDLRENGGGYLDTMQSIASYFCKNSEQAKPVVAVADYGGKRVSYKAFGNRYAEYFSQDSRVCVLADGYSASASECLIGCMIDYGAIEFSDICLAERNGAAKTYGKGIMQETRLINLLKQDAITLTTAEIRWPTSDRSIHGRGVLPEDGALTVEENVDYETETVNAINKLLGK